MTSKSPIGVSTILTAFGVVLCAVFSFAFNEIENTKDTATDNKLKLAEHEIRINHIDTQLDQITKQILMLNSKIDNGNDAILKAIKEKK